MTTPAIEPPKAYDAGAELVRLRAQVKHLQIIIMLELAHNYGEAMAEKLTEAYAENEQLRGHLHGRPTASEEQDANAAGTTL